MPRWDDISSSVRVLVPLRCDTGIYWQGRGGTGGWGYVFAADQTRIFT